ncbi:AraC family transcriptional regulator [Vibrio mangrovi]|uniref:AraC family transcriptional regulator n=2 Tax=Vibrio mangrovi TaxID=474394 RepID=A0ABU4IAH5_9VIBR|nr:AraC family transcriptional regulator [Vibrio mangrovi]MDW6004970.1 AraC family transcriptional regulator [Vibrio mangrovi]
MFHRIFWGECVVSVQEEASRFASSQMSIPKPAEVMTLPSGMDCHAHRYTQIVVCLSGMTEFEISGYGNRVGPGQGCIVLAGASHAFGGIADSADIMVLNLPAPSSESPVYLQQINDLSHSQSYFCLDEPFKNLIRILGQEITSSPDDKLLSQACHDTLVSILPRHMTGYVPRQRESRFDIEAIDHYITRHIGQPITVAQLAGSVFLGESQFHSHFKAVTGMTPYQYVLNKRVEMAKSLIEQGRYTLGQIADITGFSGQSTFSHAFIRQLGLSPSAYKKRCQVQ